MSRAALLALLAVLPIVVALDCRKFSFAPACRGIMLKRSEVAAVQETEPTYDLASHIELLRYLLREAEAEVEKHQNAPPKRGFSSFA